MLNFDRESIPDEPDSEAERLAKDFSPHYLVMVNGEVSFNVFGHFLPRVGEKIGLQDGKVVVVRHILYSLTEIGNCYFSLPHVWAETI